jgi:hypothetical protein
MHLPCVIDPWQSAAAVFVPALIPLIPAAVNAGFFVVISMLLSSLLLLPLLSLLPP